MLELLAVITAIGMVATLYLTALRAPSAGTVEAAARSLAAEIEAALDQAQAREGEMLLDTSPAREGVGRYVVIAGEVGIGAPPASGGGWTTL
ncbi:MAG: hypothetical protein M3483_02295, partial [Gemmatimonadota bacterium]|nr:hypothetical protein [Gemmatimonadota bacterium]